MKRNPVFSRLAALADPIRGRLLAVLERHEMTVGELHRALQLPQSTVSRHLRALTDAGWVASREDGTSNLYRSAATDAEPSARRLWLAVREDLAALATVQRDAERVRGVLAARHTASQKFFASGAGQWERMRRELYGERAELFALLGLLEPDAVVADLGCGTGQLAEAVAPFVARLIAVDESAAMIRAARARLSAARNVEFRQGTLESLPLQPAEVDLAMVSLVLHYLADPAQVLGQVRRTLRPGGRLVLLDVMPHDRTDLRDSMGHAWLGFRAEQLDAWAMETGFSSCRHAAVPPQPHARGPNLFVAVLEAPA